MSNVTTLSLGNFTSYLNDSILPASIQSCADKIKATADYLVSFYGNQSKIYFYLSLALFIAYFLRYTKLFNYFEFLIVKMAPERKDFIMKWYGYVLIRIIEASIVLVLMSAFYLTFAGQAMQVSVSTYSGTV